MTASDRHPGFGWPKETATPATATPTARDRHRQAATPDRQAATAGGRQDDRHSTATSDRQTARAGGEGGDRQALTPTHRIVKAPPRPPASEPAEPDSLDEEYDEGPVGLRGRMSEAFNGLRFVRQSPGSLHDQIEYAQDGAYSAHDGWWRIANIVFAKTIARIGLTVCYLFAWAFFTRLGRCLTSCIVTAAAFAVLNFMPLTAWLIPDGLDVTTWPGAVVSWFDPEPVAECGLPLEGE